LCTANQQEVEFLYKLQEFVPAQLIAPRDLFYVFVKEFHLPDQDARKLEKQKTVNQVLLFLH